MSPATTEEPLADKLAFLRRPQAYPGGRRDIEARETHMSWVFLDGRCAYKLKKPLRQPYLDYSSLRQRRLMCEQEVRLNRRLADWVYVGVAALVRDAAGDLALRNAGEAIDGQVVEWLVQMRRLPDALMLDHAIRHGTVREADAMRTATHLATFFARAPGVARTGDAHVRSLRRLLAEHAAAIDSAVAT